MQKNLKLIFIPAKKTQLVDQLWKMDAWQVMAPMAKKNPYHSSLFVGQLYMEKPLWKLKDWPLLKGIRKDFFSLCTENHDGTEPFPHDIPRQYYDQTLWFDSTGSILKPLMKVRNGLITDSYGTATC